MLILTIAFTFVFLAFLMGIKTMGNVQVGLIGFGISMLVAYGYSRIVDKRKQML